MTLLGQLGGCPSNTVWPGPRPTSVPSCILIHPTESRRDTELLSSGSGDWRGDGRDTSTHHSERPSITNEDDEISTFSLLAAAVILAAMQCAFLCAH